MKKLYRSQTNKTLYGVLGGLGEYFDVDPTILRLGFIFFTVVSLGLGGLIVYLLAVLVVPENPNGSRSDDEIEVIPNNRKSE
jgi:phage shock protein C